MQGYCHATRLCTRPHLRAGDVEKLYQDGYLSKRGNRYSSNARTEKILIENGFDLSVMEPIEVPKPPSKPKESAEDVTTDIFQRLAELDIGPEISENWTNLDALQLEVARQLARDGNPFPLIRLQWPQLVITDSLDRSYFAKHCERDHDKDLRLDDKQCRFLNWVFDRQTKEVATKGCTSPGKGFAAAIAINLWYDIFPDPIVLLSKSSDHAKLVMFAEVAKWRRLMQRVDENEVLLTETIKDRIKPRHVITILNPEAGEGVSGIHGDNVMFVFDEASGIPEEHLNNARSPARKILAISNPRVLSGWFYNLFPKLNPDIDQVFIDRGITRAVITFGGQDCLNVRAKRLNDPSYSPPGGINVEVIDEGPTYIPEGVKIPERLIPHVRALIPSQLDFAKYRTFQLLRDPSERSWRAEGKFPEEDSEYQVTPASWFNRHCEKHEELLETIIVSGFGLDLAASLEGDSTVLVAAGAKGVKFIFKTKKTGTTETLHWVFQQARSLGIDLQKGEAPIAVDAIGVGGDRFCDLLEEHGCVVIRCKGNSRSERNPQKYINLRAELYGEFADRLSPDCEYLDPYLLPLDHAMIEEFTAHEKIYAGDMTRFQVTPKKPSDKRGVRVASIREKIGRSPDISDSVVLAYRAVEESWETAKSISQFDPSRIATGTELRGDKTVFFTADGQETEQEMDILDVDAERKLFEGMLTDVSRLFSSEVFDCSQPESPST